MPNNRLCLIKNIANKQEQEKITANDQVTEEGPIEASENDQRRDPETETFQPPAPQSKGADF